MAGVPLSASIKALTAAQVGLIAATGLVQGAQTLSGGAAPALPGGGTAGSTAGGAAAAAPAAGQFEQAITIQLVGRSFSDEDVRELIGRFNELIADGARLNVRVL